MRFCAWVHGIVHAFHYFAASTSSSSSDSSSIIPKKVVNFTVSQDAAWSRRTRGMNSNSGMTVCTQDTRNIYNVKMDFYL